MHQLYQLGRTLVDAAQRAQGATDAGMSQSEFLVLRDLFVHGESSVSEIVARTDLAQSRVSTCIRKLADRGYVVTASDPADGRRTLAQVTARVRARGMKRRTQDAEDALAPLLVGAPVKERKAIAHALERFYEIAVSADDETLKQSHVTTQDGRRTRALQVAGPPLRKRKTA
jgi:DNA-binding MarR family transcriptional regulator